MGNIGHIFLENCKNSNVDKRDETRSFENLTRVPSFPETETPCEGGGYLAKRDSSSAKKRRLAIETKREEIRETKRGEISGSWAQLGFPAREHSRPLVARSLRCTPRAGCAMALSANRGSPSPPPSLPRPYGAARLCEIIINIQPKTRGGRL